MNFPEIIIRILKKVTKKNLISFKDPVAALSRIDSLKKLKKMANTFLEFYIEKQKEDGNKKWESDLIKRNITLLTNLILEINKERHTDNLNDCHNTRKFLENNYLDFNDDERIEKYSYYIIKAIKNDLSHLFIKVIRCSPRFSYYKDLTWFNYGTLNDQIKYALGESDESIFEKYLPVLFDEIKNSRNTFFARPVFKDDVILLDTIILLIKKDNIIPANILIITLIENVIRKFGAIAYSIQTPGSTNKELDKFAYSDHPSFESVIYFEGWKSNIPIKRSRLLMEYSHTEMDIIKSSEEELRKHIEANRVIQIELDKFSNYIQANVESPDMDEIRRRGNEALDTISKLSNNLISSEDTVINIGIDIYLDFLVKGIKDDRNNIIHGRYASFGEKWRTVIYLAALQTLIRKIDWYEENVIKQSNAILE